MLDLSQITREEAERILRRACGDVFPLYGDGLVFLKKGHFAFHPANVLPVEYIFFADSPFKAERGIIVCDATAGAITINLPPVSYKDGHVLVFKRVNAGNAVTITADGTETIDGAASISLAAQWAVASIVGVVRTSSWAVL